MASPAETTPLPGRFILNPESVGRERNRRLSLALAVLVFGLVLFFFGVQDLVAGRPPEAWVVFGVVVVLFSYLIVAVLALGLEVGRFGLETRLEEEKKQLEVAVSDVRTLSGLVPICASCRASGTTRGSGRRSSSTSRSIRTPSSVTDSALPATSSCRASIPGPTPRLAGGGGRIPGRNTSFRGHVRP